MNVESVTSDRGVDVNVSVGVAKMPASVKLVDGALSVGVGSVGVADNVTSVGIDGSDGSVDVTVSVGVAKVPVSVKLGDVALLVGIVKIAGLLRVAVAVSLDVTLIRVKGMNINSKI